MSGGVTLRSLIDNKRNGDRIAIVIPQTTAAAGGGGGGAMKTVPGLQLTYSQLAAHVFSLMHTLSKSGVGKGDVVSLSLINGLEFVISFLAVTWLGAAAAPLNPNYTVDENLFYLEDTRSKHLIVSRGDGTGSTAPLARQAATLYGGVTGLVLWEVNWCTRASAVECVPVAFGNTAPSNKTTSFRASNVPGGIERTVVWTESTAAPNDVALILHTSGTTSRPKAVPLTHQNLCASVRNIIGTYGLTPSDRTLLVMPLFHVHGLVGALLATFGSCGSVALPSKFSASTFWSEFTGCDCTWYSAVPTIHQILLQHEATLAAAKHKSGGAAPPQHKTDESSAAAAAASHTNPVSLTAKPVTKNPVRGKLRFIRSCSSALAPATFAQLESSFGVPVIEAYAMTEAAHQMTSNSLPSGARKPGSVGRAQGKVRVSIRGDDGKAVATGTEAEICVTGENVMTGYLNNESANAVSFHFDADTRWFRTGDQGVMDGDGYVYLTGRLKELINRGGEKIAPLELDAVLLEHSSVAEAIAFGAPDPMYGQAVHAAIVLKAGVKPSEQLTADIQAFCKSRLAAFKVPKVLHYADTVPRTATGKIQRRFVAAHFLESAAAAAPAPKSKL